ncbi:MAG: TVP38/TMEM64 family protein [Chloroflexi bacterium]|nr:TVP38/TMEM64 family protein [Chloroflexota bacterium]
MGQLLYIVIYVLRPLLLFPATIVSLLSGFLFGPVLGVVYTVIGSNSSAMLAYGVGRYFGQGVLDAEQSGGLIQKYAQRLRENSFEAVLVMRLIFLPYDLVHYIAGFLKIDWRAFLLATIIGSIPGTISIVLLGSSFGTLDELLAGEVSLNPVALAVSIILIVVSIAISRTLKRREA